MPETYSQYNETDPLKAVILGRWEGYRKIDAYTEIVNEDQKKGLPRTEQLRPEFEAFQQVLEKNGIDVRIPHYVGKFVYDQLTPRDIAVVVHNKLVVCNMVKKSRRYEAAGIFPLISNFAGEEPDVLIPPANCLLEGGDIMVDKNRLLVGISERTNMNGFEWLSKTFGEQMEVAPLHTKKISSGEQVLHLDCTFNPVGKHHALIYEAGFESIPEFLRKEYEWIRVNKREQQALATNVISLSPEKVIARDHPDCKRLTGEMRNIGIQVEEVIFDAAPSTGGSFRCCTLPLIRG